MSGREMVLTERQRTAACVLFGLACLVFAEDRDRDVWWYRWVTDRSHRARDPFESACWWAMRFANEQRERSAEEWLSYVAYVFAYRGAPGGSVRP